MRTVILLLFVCVVGCSPVATYPPIETEEIQKLTKSAYKPVSTILVKTIEYMHSRFGGMDEVVFNLPVGMGVKTYAVVSERVGDAIGHPAEPMSYAGQPAYHIVELRVRGLEADADVLFPSSSGEYKMVTLHLESSMFTKWHVTRDRVWLVPVKELPSPNDPAATTQS